MFRITAPLLVNITVIFYLLTHLTKTNFPFIFSYMNTLINFPVRYWNSACLETLAGWWNSCKLDDIIWDLPIRALSGFTGMFEHFDRRTTVKDDYSGCTYCASFHMIFLIFIKAPKCSVDFLPLGSDSSSPRKILVTLSIFREIYKSGNWGFWISSDQDTHHIHRFYIS